MRTGLLEAFLLYKAGKIKKILISGTSQPYLMAAKKGETRLAAQLLLDWGVKAGDIIYEERSRNTRENAIFSARILRSKFPGGKYLLITSAFHMRRSLGCLAKVNIDADAFPADFYGGEYPLDFQFLFVPNSNALAYFDLLWHEWTGYIMYKLVGYS
ncbi:YdcF family protein [Dyadobacter sp. NIV53]|uniref:YdcF family protein n=1 Tax=Dyadobacter sp. NIV53 TaxID=2861765 RepID=UPI001E60432D|nr:YdcF family protein [Dyadobacter sp. NIV53]